MIKEQIIRDALALPTTAIDYHVSQYLAEKFPEKTLVEGNDELFNIETYANEVDGARPAILSSIAQRIIRDM